MNIYVCVCYPQQQNSSASWIPISLLSTTETHSETNTYCIWILPIYTCSVHTIRKQTNLSGKWLKSDHNRIYRRLPAKITFANILNTPMHTVDSQFRDLIAATHRCWKLSANRWKAQNPPSHSEQDIHIHFMGYTKCKCGLGLTGTLLLLLPPSDCLRDKRALCVCLGTVYHYSGITSI